MSAASVTKLKPEADAPAPVTGLDLLRKPFPDHQVSKLPKETKKQAEDRKRDQDAGNWPAKCSVCGGLHHPRAVHLDYVGHAAATDRLLDADPRWTWAPVADPVSKGLPTAPGGMWIELTVDGVTRLGFGDAAGKVGGDAVKEAIGDAIRNAGMRFGMALDLWHKGDLHVDAPADEGPVLNAEQRAIQHLRNCSIDRNTFKDAWESNKEGWKGLMDETAYRRVVAAMKEIAATLPEPPAPPPAAKAQQPIGQGDFVLDDDIPF